MRPFSEMGDDELSAALRGVRPESSPAFAAELDQRVAAGFPRRAGNPFARLAAWVCAGTPRRRLVIPAGGFAMVVIVVATVVVSANQGGSEPEVINSSLGAISGEEQAARSHAKAHSGTGGSEEASEASAPSGGTKSSETVSGTEMPAAGAAESSPVHATEGAAAGTAHRDVERAAEITIGTKRDEVGDASSKVFEAVHAYDGIVLNSSTRDGSGAHAEATFELLVPSGKVGDAMAAFSRIGEVLSRHESTADITAPTIGAGERLQDSQARIDGLLAQLSGASTELEREVVEAELNSERRHAAHLKSRLSGLKRRANLSHVSVRIESGRGALTPGGGAGGGWDIGDAVHDAGHLLSIAAGVTIVALAVLSPLMLLALLAWLAGRVWTRRARERALT